MRREWKLHPGDPNAREKMKRLQKLWERIKAGEFSHMDKGWVSVYEDGWGVITVVFDDETELANSLLEASNECRTNI